MNAHSHLWFAYHINHMLDRANGLGAARFRRRFTSVKPSTLSPHVWLIRSASSASTLYAVVLDALRPPQEGQFQPTLAPVAVKSP